MPGRKRTPNSIKEANGNPGHRPIQPSVEYPGVPTCPRWLDRDAKKEWKRITEALADLDLLRMTDVGVLASYCVAFSRWITAEKTLATEGTTIKVTGSQGQERWTKHPSLLVSSEAQKQMLRAGSLLGFNPVDRSKVNAPPRQLANPFSLLDDDE